LAQEVNIQNVTMRFERMEDGEAEALAGELGWLGPGGPAKNPWPLEPGRRGGSRLVQQDRQADKQAFAGGPPFGQEGTRR
jgi:hypothetical protein